MTELFSDNSRLPRMIEWLKRIPQIPNIPWSQMSNPLYDTDVQSTGDNNVTIAFRVSYKKRSAGSVTGRRSVSIFAVYLSLKMSVWFSSRLYIRVYTFVLTPHKHGLANCHESFRWLYVPAAFLALSDNSNNRNREEKYHGEVHQFETMGEQQYKYSRRITHFVRLNK